MSLHLVVNGRPVFFTGDVPAGAEEAKLYNSTSFFHAAQYGSLWVQYINEYGFVVLYTTAAIEENTAITVGLTGPVFFCCINLLQGIQVQPAGGAAVICKRSSVCVAFSSLSGYTLNVRKGTHRAVIIIYPVSFVKAQLLRFPLLEELAEKLKREQPWLLPNVVTPLFAAITNAVYEILHVPRMFFTVQHHRANMKQLLNEIFRHMEGSTPVQPLVSLSDVEGVKKAKEWIDMNLDKHIPIAELARKAGLNEFKLKKGFKELYHIGLYGYLLRQRMLIAKKQLEDTALPVREIARRAGYRKAVNFSAAFRRVYGITPNQHRQNSR